MSAMVEDGSSLDGRAGSGTGWRQDSDAGTGLIDVEYGVDEVYTKSQPECANFSCAGVGMVSGNESELDGGGELCRSFYERRFCPEPGRAPSRGEGDCVRRGGPDRWTLVRYYTT